jgi:hypothetical protein
MLISFLLKKIYDLFFLYVFFKGREISEDESEENP